MNDNAELKELFDPILDAILKYENDYDSITAIREIAEDRLGKNWRDVIAEYLVIYDDEVRENAEAKLNQAMDYDGALLAWDEANYLISEESVTPDQVRERYHDLKGWLQYFGDDGKALVDQLREKIGGDFNDDEEDDDQDDDASDDEEDTDDEAISDDEDEDGVIAGGQFNSVDGKTSPFTERKPDVPAKNNANEVYDATEGVRYKGKPIKLDDSFAEEYDISKEVLWDFNAFLILNDYYDQTISRIGARCVRMGGLALNEYPYYGYVLDLLDEIITIGSNIESEEKLVPLFEKYFKGGYIEFKKVLKNYRKEFEEDAPPEMMADNSSTELDRMIKELGDIDTSKVKDSEDDLYTIGRAKSEFDPIDDDDASLPQAPPPPPVTSIKDMGKKNDDEED